MNYPDTDGLHNFWGEETLLKGDCNECINKCLPEDSIICIECGLSRKNFINVSEIIPIIKNYGEYSMTTLDNEE